MANGSFDPLQQARRVWRHIAEGPSPGALQGLMWAMAMTEQSTSPSKKFLHIAICFCPLIAICVSAWVAVVLQYLILDRTETAESDWEKRLVTNALSSVLILLFSAVLWASAISLGQGRHIRCGGTRAIGENRRKVSVGYFVYIIILCMLLSVSAVALIVQLPPHWLWAVCFAIPALCALGSLVAEIGAGRGLLWQLLDPDPEAPAEANRPMAGPGSRDA